MVRKSRRLPAGWRAGNARNEPLPFDATVELRAPDGAAGRIVLEAKARLDPRGVLAVATIAEEAATRGPLVAVSPYLSPSTRERLREHDIGYLDLTGNARIVTAKPALFIETDGPHALHRRPLAEQSVEEAARLISRP